MTKESAFENLKFVAIQAVEYVGSANYQERENHAKREIYRCFGAFERGDYDAIEFRQARD